MIGGDGGSLGWLGHRRGDELSMLDPFARSWSDPFAWESKHASNSGSAREPQTPLSTHSYSEDFIGSPISG